MSNDSFASGGPVQFNIGELLKEAWNLFSANVGTALGGFVVYAVIVSACSGLSWGIVTVVIGGPMTLGLATLFLRVARREQPDFAVLFSGFQRFLPAFVAYLLICVFMSVGFILCIIPGLVVSFLYTLTFFYMTDKNLDFWPAMEASRKTMSANVGPWVLVVLTLIGLNLLGTLACCVGTLVTAPLSMLMLALAYDQVEHGGMTVQDQLPPESPVA